MKRPTVLLIGLLGLGGCASIIDGSSQSLSVKAVSDGVYVAGAQCTLVNNKGTWYVTTPGTVTVHRSYDELNVKCSKPGFIPNVGSVPSTTRNMALGNIFFGGLIGTSVDMGTGAAYDYPTPIVVQLQPATSVSLGTAPGS